MYSIALFSDIYKVYKLYKRKILMKSELKMLIYINLVSSIVCLKHLLSSTEKKIIYTLFRQLFIKQYRLYNYF